MAKKKWPKKKQMTKAAKAKKKTAAETVIIALNADDEEFLIGPKQQLIDDLTSLIEMHSLDPQERVDYFKRWKFYVVSKTRKVTVDIDLRADLFISIEKGG